MEEHLISLGVDGDEDLNFDNNNNNNNSSDDDSSVEIMSTVDECENELIRLSTYLQLESEVDNDDQSNDSQQVLLATRSIDNVHNQEKSVKRIRRQWSVKEKLDTVTLFEKNHSKPETANKKGCTTAQLRNWIKNK